jgi:hypothetical protein
MQIASISRHSMPPAVAKTMITGMEADRAAASSAVRRQSRRRPVRHSCCVRRRGRCVAAAAPHRGANKGRGKISWPKPIRKHIEVLQHNRVNSCRAAGNRRGGF